MTVNGDLNQSVYILKLYDQEIPQSQTADKPVE